jgi:hypothetical protein
MDLFQVAGFKAFSAFEIIQRVGLNPNSTSSFGSSKFIGTLFKIAFYQDSLIELKKIFGILIALFCKLPAYLQLS